MPHHLDIHFSEEISSTHVQLVLMHENEGIINKVDEGLIENAISRLQFS